MTSFRLAWLNLVRRRVTAAIALTAIALSVACSGMLLKLYILSGSRFATMATGFDAVVGAKSGGMEMLLGSLNLEGDYPGFVPYALFDSLQGRKVTAFSDGTSFDPACLRSVTPFVYFGHSGDYRLVGADESFVNRPAPGKSLAFEQGRWVATNGEVVAGAEVARARRFHVGDTVACMSWGGSDTNGPVRFDLRVAGILKPTGMVWDRALFSSVAQAQAVLRQLDLRGQTIPAWGPRVLNYYLISLEPGAMAQLEALVNKRTVGQVISVEKEKARLAELTGTGRRLGFLMTAMMLLLGGLCVAAMMVTRFDAMTVQLAVLRAIGYEKREIAAWLVWEGLLLGVSACLIGGAIDGAWFPWIRSMLGSTLPAAYLVPSPLYQSAPVWGTAILATVIAVFIPLFRLYRQNIHDSLRGL